MQEGALVALLALTLGVPAVEASPDDFLEESVAIAIDHESALESHAAYEIAYANRLAQDVAATPPISCEVAETFHQRQSAVNLVVGALWAHDVIAARQQCHSANPHADYLMRFGMWVEQFHSSTSACAGEYSPAPCWKPKPKYYSLSEPGGASVRGHGTEAGAVLHPWGPNEPYGTFRACFWLVQPFNQDTYANRYADDHNGVWRCTPPVVVLAYGAL